MISKKILVPAGFKQVIEVLQKRIPDLISVYCLYLDLNEQRKGILEDVYKRGYVYG